MRGVLLVYEQLQDLDSDGIKENAEDARAALMMIRRR
jgi:hypothetical protein